MCHMFYRPGYPFKFFCRMQFKVILISVFFAFFDFIKASNKRQKLELVQKKQLEISDESMSETESLTTNEIFSSSGKRSAASILSSSPSPRSDYASLRPANGILKGSRQNTLMRRVIFNQTKTYNDVHDFRSPEAESKYFEALYKRKFNMAYEMRKQGLMLSGSNLCFSYMNSILRSEHDCRGILTFLLKNQPNVFFQPFDCGQNVFYNATQFNINFLMERTAHIPGAQMMIFKEVLRNPELTIDNNFFLYPRPDRAWEMIELAEASGRQDMITKCYIQPGSLMYYDLDGETFFIKTSFG